MRTQLRQQQIKQRRQVIMVQGYTDLNACTSGVIALVMVYRPKTKQTTYNNEGIKRTQI